MTRERATGALLPWVREEIRGWAQPGARVRIEFDGEPIGTVRADEPGLFPLRAPANSRCGFSLRSPAELRDGRVHVIAATDADSGRPLEGGPLRYRSGGVTGRAERVDGNIVRGFAQRRDAPAEPVTVAAISGSEVVAVAVAKPRFQLIVPEALLRSGAGFLHVVVMGSDVMLEGSPVLLPRLAPEPLIVRPRRPRPVTAAIKISAPNLRVAHEWGDYHFANALQAALLRRGWIARVDCADAWNKGGDEVVIALRGRHRYEPPPGTTSLLWIISHPDRLAPGEADSFDHVFVAASAYARELARTTARPVEVLHQATDSAVFRGDDPIAPPSPLLFVGNSRREYRRMVRWCVEEGLDVAVYGTLWSGVIPDRLIRGEHIANADLHRWYAGAAVVLNDHWDTMLSGGFLSNRLFDASAAGAFIITDPVAGLAEVFGDSIETAESGASLAEKVRYYAAHPEQAREKAEAARALVRQGHTFDHRAEVIVRTAERLMQARGPAAA